MNPTDVKETLNVGPVWPSLAQLQPNWAKLGPVNWLHSLMTLLVVWWNLNQLPTFWSSELPEPLWTDQQRGGP